MSWSLSRSVFRSVLVATLASTSLRAPALAAPPTVGAPAIAQPPTAPGRLHVLLINGGGSREENFQSHIAHLRELTAHLLAAKVPKEQITILSADGADPAADVATRDPAPKDLWRLEGTPLAEVLDEPLRYVDGSVPGMTLLPATRASLSQTLLALRTRVAAGDTLFVYVTDHGTNHPRDPLRNQITLWGAREGAQGISVRQQGAELSRLPPGLRVVTVMSQCFSGAFAHLRETLVGAARTKLPICGYFASPADRPAYGCFPEADRNNRTGHAFTVIDALTRNGRLPDVHADVLLNDRSPDVPQRTSDAFLFDVLSRAAERAGTPLEAFADRLLEGRGNKAPPEAAVAERLARAYGVTTPLSLAALTKQIDELVQSREMLGKHQNLWESALSDSTRAQLEEFQVANPTWRPRLRVPVIRRLAPEARAALTRELLAALAAFAETRPALSAIAEKLLSRVDEAAALAYQLDVREAAFQRVRILLVGAAARLHLAAAGTPAERNQLAAIDQCEALELPRASGVPARPPVSEPFAPRAAEAKAVAALRPAYLGVAFRPAAVAVRRRHGLGDGAALVTTVVGGSPAAAAGLGPGDIIIGEPGAPFARENQVRAFTMLSSIATPVRLEILRQGQRSVVDVKLTLVPEGR
ncbi:MAG TPA: PDZ domain-containing protein [Polyangia bacterium]